jgi:hypothetical protein
MRPKMERRMARLRAARDRRDRFDVQPSTSLGLLAILTALVGAPILLLVWLLPATLVLPMFSLVSLAAAGAAALLAWRSGAERDLDGITLWDVAGALAFFGFAAGMLSEPTHVAELFGLATAAQ